MNNLDQQIKKGDESTPNLIQEKVGSLAVSIRSYVATPKPIIFFRGDSRVHFEKIWSKYRARIRAFLQSRVSNPSDVDDLLQEISIKVFRGLSTIKSSQKIQPWLFQTAHRTIIDFYRKSAKERGLNSDDTWYAGDDPQTLNELERCVEPFLHALSAEMAAMLLAIDIEGVSQKEYARTKGFAYSTMKSRVQKARSNLRKLFEDCCLMSLDANGNTIDYRSKSDICEKC